MKNITPTTPTISIFVKQNELEKTFDALFKYDHTLLSPKTFPAIIAGLISSYTEQLAKANHITHSEKEGMEAWLIEGITRAIVNDQIGGAKNGQDALDEFNK